MSFGPGKRIGDYEVVGVLGAGGMGEVYKVRNTLTNRTEAAKVLLPNLAGDPDLADRFIREIRIHASLEHPNIAALRTAQRVDNQLLMIMELVEGTTLEEVLHQGRIPLNDALRYADQVLSALVYAHEQGVIHRDIKPSNMMLTPGGTVKLMDFGIAKAAADHALTQTGQTVGSLYYMSPEQIQGSTNLDARSDVYSLGISLYEIATGKRPFQGDSQYSVMAAHLKETPAPPIQIDPALPVNLNEIILMAIAKQPEKRFQSARAMQQALGTVTPTVTFPVPTVPEIVPATRPEQAPASPVSAQPAKRSHRALYMVAGSLATIAVLILALTQLPKWRQTEAAVDSSDSAATEMETPAAPEVLSDEPDSEPTPAQLPPAGAEVLASRAEGEPPPRAVPPSRTQRAAPSPAPAPVSETPASTPRAAREAPPARPAPAATFTPPASPVAAPHSEPAAPPDDGARQAALQESRDRMMLMAVRIGAVSSGLANIQQEQARSGLTMRGDITASQTRMELNMDAAESALNQADPAAAKKSLDFAERELEKLEKFLGL